MTPNIDFHPVSLEDREHIQRFARINPYRNCDFSFANLYNWSSFYNTEVAYHKDMLLVRFKSAEAERTAYLMPVGDGDLLEVLQDMDEDMQAKYDHSLTLMGVTTEGLELLQRTYPDRLHVLSSRDYSDYIYLREKLSTLSGKKLQSKRNHINRFERTYPSWSYEEIDESNVRECLQLEKVWFRQSEQGQDIVDEKQMVYKALSDYERIGMMGGCIRVEGQIIAFSLGMEVNADTFDVCIEKADTDYDGAFTIINREFARRIPEQYTYVNREEDLGLEGLRKAKLSYKPVEILAKHTVILSYDE